MKPSTSLLFAFSFLFLLSCTAQQKNSQVAPDEFEKGIEKGNIQLLDVRTPGEYKNGHIAHTMQANWNDQSQFLERIGHLDKSKTVYIYCASGARSAAAASWMRNNGFDNVVELQGGIINWKRQNKPVETAVAEKQLTLEEYRAMIPSSGTVLVDFGAEWCPPCVKMNPVISEIEQEVINKVTILKIDVGVHTEILSPLHIESYPTFIVYKNGKESWRQTGIIEKNTLLAQLK